MLLWSWLREQFGASSGMVSPVFRTATAQQKSFMLCVDHRCLANSVLDKLAVTTQHICIHTCNWCSMTANIRRLTAMLSTARRQDKHTVDLLAYLTGYLHFT